MFYSIQEGHRSVHLKHNPLNALVAPRPIGWVSTRGADGRSNLAPFSYYNLASLDPPIVMFAPNEKDAGGNPKDTLRNIRDTGEFVVNVVSWELRLAMNLTSTPLECGDSEFLLAGLKEAPSVLVKPPRVAECPAALECRLIQIVALPSRPGGRQSHAVFGEIVGVHVQDTIIKDGLVDVLKIAPMARLGGTDYTSVEQIVVIPRPTLGSD
jgi:flavin reductase (DIM6/NTAB) family NADH-FMN oxidoreductase RutF